MSSSQRDRFYVRTARYHVWAVMERHPDNLDASKRPDSYLDTVVCHYGARGRGDAAAREQARLHAERLNAGA